MNFVFSSFSYIIKQCCSTNNLNERKKTNEKLKFKETADERIPKEFVKHRMDVLAGTQARRLRNQYYWTHLSEGEKAQRYDYINHSIPYVQGDQRLKIERKNKRVVLEIWDGAHWVAAE